VNLPHLLSHLFPVLGAAVTLIVLRLLLWQAHRLPLDHPNERSLHSKPIPRVGGIAIMLGVVVGGVGISVLGASGNLLLILLLALGLAGISFVDDVHNLPVGVRLLAQLGIAAVAVFLSVNLAWWLLILLVLAVVWMTNLFNFMDGSDGLAGGMTVFGFGAYALAAWDAGNPVLALVAASIALPALVFLAFNFNPARVFMGDAGSIPLGFLAAGLGIAGWQSGAWPVWLPLLVFSPFICDASVTLTRRLLRGERVWQAHKEHFYQQLVQLGWGHRRTACAEYLLMAFCTGSALWFRAAPAYAVGLMLAGFAGVYVVIMLAVHRAWCEKRAGMTE